MVLYDCSHSPPAPPTPDTRGCLTQPAPPPAPANLTAISSLDLRLDFSYPPLRTWLDSLDNSASPLLTSTVLGHNVTAFVGFQDSDPVAPCGPDLLQLVLQGLQTQGLSVDTLTCVVWQDVPAHKVGPRALGP